MNYNIPCFPVSMEHESLQICTNGNCQVISPKFSIGDFLYFHFPGWSIGCSHVGIFEVGACGHWEGLAIFEHTLRDADFSIEKVFQWIVHVFCNELLYKFAANYAWNEKLSSNDDGNGKILKQHIFSLLKTTQAVRVETYLDSCRSQSASSFVRSSFAHKTCFAHGGLSIGIST